VSLVLSLPAAAVEVATLFTAEVAYDQESSDPRADAYEAALQEILLRVSGSGIANNPEVLAELFPNPASYVVQFRPGADETLWVSFDGQAIERTLRGAGQTFWGAERPLTLVWLAVDWGQGEREIIAADDPDRTQQESRSIDRDRLLRERLLEIAERRGLPLVFPLLDTTDLQSVTFADIWGGFDEMMLAASSQGSRWTYYFSGVDRALSGPPEAVVSQIADLLAAEFAVGGDAPVETVVLNVSGIASVEAYGSVQEMLNDISLIEHFAVTEVSGDRVSYRVDVRGGTERLGRALRFNGLVEQEGMDAMQPAATLEFYYNP
jgi:hypothetical protein